MSKYLTITTFVTLLIFLMLPQVASAFFPFEGPLVPCGTKAHPEECTLCDLFIVGQNVIYLFLTLIISVATIILLFGGFTLLTSGGVPERQTHGKRIITYTVIGLLITFGSWLIINTVLIELADSVIVEGQEIGKIKGFQWPWTRFECEFTVSEPPGGVPEPPGEVPEPPGEVPGEENRMCECIQQVQSATNIPAGTSDTQVWCQQYVQNNCPSNASSCSVTKVSQNAYTGTWWCDWEAIWKGQFGPGPCSDCSKDSGVCLRYFNNTLLRQCSEPGTTCSASCL